MVGLLASLKAGGVYVPIDPAYPPERIRLIIEDSRVAVVLTQAHLAEGLRGLVRDAVCLDADWSQITLHDGGRLPNAARPDSLAYVIYTSGSTGIPKGVAIQHRSAAALIHWSTQHFNPEQLAGVLASTSICFDLSVFELFTTLSSGGKVMLVENALQLPALVASREVTLINTVPSVMMELERAGGIPSFVATVCLAGEALHNALAQRIYQCEHISEVYNLYGPTEDTTYSTWRLIEKGSDAAVTIGRPVANTQVYILDAQLHPVPAGVTGELHIGGDGLARGYLGRPELTAERFIPNPYTGLQGRVYTGRGTWPATCPMAILSSSAELTTR